MESYEEFCKARLAQIKAKVMMEESSLSAASSRGSLIRFHGVAILSPMLSSEQKKEMRDYQVKSRTLIKSSNEKLLETQRSTPIRNVHAPSNREACKLVHSLPVTDEIGEACSTNVERDPVKMTSDQIKVKSGISKYHTGSSCLNQLVRRNPRISSNKNNERESGDSQRIADHALRTVSVRKTKSAKHKATNSKEANVCQVESNDSEVIPRDNETSGASLDLFHLAAKEINLNGISPSETTAPSLQSLLKKSRECRDKQRQQKRQKSLHFKGEAVKLSDKEVILCASKVCKNTRERRTDLRNIMPQNTLLNPDPSLSSASSWPFNPVCKHNYISAARNVSPAKTTELLSFCNTLSEENENDKRDDVDPSIKHNVYCFSKEEPKEQNTSSCSKRLPVCSDFAGQVSQCQKRGVQVNSSLRRQNRGFMVPNIALSGSPVLSRKWACSSQKLLVNVPLDMDSEIIE